jgi:hypothetical protein
MSKKGNSPFEKALDAVDRLTPKPGKGFNVVGVDEYEPPGEELYLVRNCSTEEEAKKVLAAKQKEVPGQRFYIYPPSEDGKFDPA